MQSGRVSNGDISVAVDVRCKKGSTRQSFKLRYMALYGGDVLDVYNAVERGVADFVFHVQNRFADAVELYRVVAVIADKVGCGAFSVQPRCECAAVGLALTHADLGVHGQSASYRDGAAVVDEHVVSRSARRVACDDGRA